MLFISISMPLGCGMSPWGNENVSSSPLLDQVIICQASETSFFFKSCYVWSVCPIWRHNKERSGWLILRDYSPVRSARVFLKIVAAKNDEWCRTLWEWILLPWQATISREQWIHSVVKLRMWMRGNVGSISYRCRILLQIGISSRDRGYADLNFFPTTPRKVSKEFHCSRYHQKHTMPQHALLRAVCNDLSFSFFFHIGVYHTW